MDNENRDLEKGESGSEKLSAETSTETLSHEEIGIGRPRSESIATDVTTNSSSLGQGVEEEIPSNSVPTNDMSHPHSGGGDLEKGPRGAPNRTVDEEGKIVVNWTSRKDPENPRNWPRNKKIFNVAIISAMTFLCPLSSAMFVRSPPSPFSLLMAFAILWAGG
jgi:hypothetical protein